MKKFSRRGRIRAVSFLTALLVSLVAWAVSETFSRQEYQRRLAVSQQRALSGLNGYIADIETSLTKGMYSNTPPMLTSLSSSLWRDASGAKDCLEQLGDGTQNLANTYKFLSQVGEFTVALNKKLTAGEKITESEREQLEKLLSCSHELSGQFDYMLSMLNSGALSFEALEKSELRGSEKTEMLSFSDAIGDTEQTLTDYPTLIYDGPFADNIEVKESEMLKNAKPVSDTDAAKTAAEVLGCKVEELEKGEDENGKMPAYVFSFGSASAAITKNGGYPCYMLGEVYSGENALDARDAIEKARVYLEKIGYSDMKDSYYAESDGICTVNFAYEQNGIICYTDLIKVSVALDTGAVTAVDARGYIMNHYERDIPVPAVDAKTALASVSPYLSVSDSRLAVIPSDGTKEYLAYEFTCKSKDRDVLVYIDAFTGNEDEILLLTYSDGGVLTK